MKKNKKTTIVEEKPLAPQIEQHASFDLTVITSSYDDDDAVGQEKVGISIVPYIDDDEEAPGPPHDNKRIEEVTKYSTYCGSFSLSALKVAVIMILVLLLVVFVVVLTKSGKAYGKWWCSVERF